MAAFAPLHSAEWLEFVATPAGLQESWKWGGKLRTTSASLTFTGAGTGTAKMFRLPAGAIRVLTGLCRIVCPAGSTNVDVHIGYAAYVKEDGTAGTADDNAFADNLDAGTALDQTWPLPAVGYLDLNSRNGIDVEVLIDTANSAASGELWLKCAYVVSN